MLLHQSVLLVSFTIQRSGAAVLAVACSAKSNGPIELLVLLQDRSQSALTKILKFITERLSLASNIPDGNRPVRVLESQQQGRLKLPSGLDVPACLASHDIEIKLLDTVVR